MFSTKPWIFQWFTDQFERKWNNTAPNGAMETDWFVPLAPDKPVAQSPADASTGQPLSLALRWDGGYDAHFYDVYFGTDPNPPLFAANLPLGPTDPTAPTVTQKIVLPLLQHGTTYYWRMVGRTMAGKTAKSEHIQLHDQRCGAAAAAPTARRSNDRDVGLDQRRPGGCRRCLAVQ